MSRTPYKVRFPMITRFQYRLARVLLALAGTVVTWLLTLRVFSSPRVHVHDALRDQLANIVNGCTAFLALCMEAKSLPESAGSSHPVTFLDDTGWDGNLDHEEAIGIIQSYHRR